MSGRVLLLGDPGLRIKCRPVDDVSDTALAGEISLLKRELDDFRKEKGFGRAIAAPQIGIRKRFIALNLGKGTFVIFNPVITWHSTDTFTLWDDCMSFPDLFIRVKRYASISMTYRDEAGTTRTWETMGMAESELLQHETDHLDGVLAIDRAIDKEGIIYRSVFENNREYFECAKES